MGKYLTFDEWKAENQQASEEGQQEIKHFQTFDEWQESRITPEVRKKYYDASGIDTLRRDFNSYAKSTYDYLTQSYKPSAASAAESYQKQNEVWRQHIQKERDYFERYSKFFTQEELTAFESELQSYEGLLGDYAQVLGSGKVVSGYMDSAKKNYTGAFWEGFAPKLGATEAENNPLKNANGDSVSRDMALAGAGFYPLYEEYEQLYRDIATSLNSSKNRVGIAKTNEYLKRIDGVAEDIRQARVYLSANKTSFTDEEYHWLLSFLDSREKSLGEMRQIEQGYSDGASMVNPLTGKKLIFPSAQKVDNNGDGITDAVTPLGKLGQRQTSETFADLMSAITEKAERENYPFQTAQQQIDYATEYTDDLRYAARHSDENGSYDDSGTGKLTAEKLQDGSIVYTDTKQGMTPSEAKKRWEEIESRIWYVMYAGIMSKEEFDGLLTHVYAARDEYLEAFPEDGTEYQREMNAAMVLTLPEEKNELMREYRYQTGITREGLATDISRAQAARQAPGMPGVTEYAPTRYSVDELLKSTEARFGEYFYSDDESYREIQDHFVLGYLANARMTQAEYERYMQILDRYEDDGFYTQDIAQFREQRESNGLQQNSQGQQEALQWYPNADGETFGEGLILGGEDARDFVFDTAPAAVNTGLTRGVGYVALGVGKALSWLGIDAGDGIADFGDEMTDYSDPVIEETKQQQYNRHRQYSEKIENEGKIWKWIYNRLPDLSNTMTLMGVSGVIGGVASGSSAAAAAGSSGATASPLAIDSARAGIYNKFLSATAGFGTSAWAIKNAELLAMAGYASIGDYAEQLDKDNTPEQRVVHALAAGAMEYMSEKLFSGNPLLDDDAGAVTKLVYNLTENETVRKIVSSSVADWLGEGFEEVISSLGMMGVDYALYGNSDATAEQFANDFTMGILVSTIMLGGNKVVEAFCKTDQYGHLKHISKFDHAAQSDISALNGQMAQYMIQYYCGDEKLMRNSGMSETEIQKAKKAWERTVAEYNSVFDSLKSAEYYEISQGVSGEVAGQDAQKIAKAAEGRLGDTDMQYFTMKTAVEDANEVVEAWGKAAHSALEGSSANAMMTSAANAIKLAEAAQINLDNAHALGWITEELYESESDNLRLVSESATEVLQDILDGEMPGYSYSGETKQSAGIEADSSAATETMPQAEKITDGSRHAEPANIASGILDGILRGEITSETISSSQIDKLREIGGGIETIADALGVEVAREATASKQRSALRAAIAQYGESNTQKAAAELPETTEGAENNGAEILDDGGERDAGMGAGEQAGAVEDSTGGQIESGAGKTEADILRDIKNDSRAQSPKEIGVTNGSEEKSVYVLTEGEIERSEAWKRMKEDAESNGDRVVFFAGELKVHNATTGGYSKVDGIRQAGTNGETVYYIKADKKGRSAEKIYKHEYFHELVSNEPEMWADLITTLYEQYSEREIVAMADRYAEAFDGIYGQITEDMTEEEAKEVTIRYLEEMFADAYADIQRARVKTSAAKRVLASQTDAVQRAEQTKRATRDTRGAPEGKFSIQNTRGMTLKDQLKRYYKKEMKSSDSFYFGETPTVLKESGLDEIPLVWTISDFRKSTSEKHNIPRRVLNNLRSNLQSPLFSFGKGDRIGIVISDIDGDGNKVLVGIERNVQMDRKPVNEIKSAYGIEHPENWIKNQIEEGKDFVLYDEERANAFLQTYGYSASVEDGIYSLGRRLAQDNENVKQKFSFDDEDYLLAVQAGDMDAAREMVDEAARAAGYTDEQIDAEEAVIYDGDGKIIPISERFDRRKRDTRGAPEQKFSVEEREDSADALKKLIGSISELETMDTVYELEGNEFSKIEGKSIVDQVMGEYDKFGTKVTRDGFGDVVFTRAKIKGDVMHGLGRAKAIAFAAAPDVIRYGKEIDHQSNWKGRGYDTYIFAAPVNLMSEKIYMCVVVQKDFQNRFYLHEVIGSDGSLIVIDKASGQIKTGSVINGLTSSPNALSNTRVSDYNENVKKKLSFDDEDYLLAVQAGDMDAAREMVDEAARAAGYTDEQIDAEEIVIYDGDGKIIPISERFNPNESDIRYSIDEDYENDINEWDEVGRPAGEVFILGSTGDILQGLGAIESDIYMQGDKIQKILEDHPEMTLDEIKKIPQILEDPVLILKSRNVGRENRTNTRLVFFGSVKAQNGKPVLSVLDLRPVEKKLVIEDMQKVSSEYTKKNDIGLIQSSEVLLADKKRTIPLLRSMGLQLRPTDLLQYDSIGSITYASDKVNLSGEKFSDVVQENKGERFSIEEDAAELDREYKKKMEDDTPEGLAPEDEDVEDYHALAKEQKQRRAEFAKESTLKSRIKASENEIAGQQAGKAALRGIGALSKAAEEKINRRVELIRETLQIDREALKKKQQASESEERQKKKEKQQAEIKEQKAKTATRELRQGLLNLFSVKAGKRAELAEQINQYADELIHSGTLTNENRRTLFDLLYENGEEVIRPDEYGKGIRSAVKNGRIYVQESVREEFGEAWDDVLKKAWESRIYFTNDKTDAGIEAWTKELASVFGEQFDATKDLKTQLKTILELAEEGKQEKVTIEEMMRRNSEEYGWSIEEQMDELERKVDHMLETFAEKADLEIRLRSESTKKLLEDQEYFRRKIEKMRRERMDNEARNKVLKRLDRLQRYKNKASPKFKEMINDTIKDIDTVARKFSSRGIEDIQELLDAYMQMKEDLGEGFITSNEIEERLQRLKKTHIDDMGIDEVRALGEALTGMITQIQQQNQMLSTVRRAEISIFAGEVQREIEASKGRTPGGKLQNYIQSHLDGKRFFAMISGFSGGATEKLAQGLSNGEERKRQFQLRAMRIFDGFMAEKENQNWLKTAAGEKAKWEKVNVTGSFSNISGNKREVHEIEITPMMKISLLMHSRNDDNLQHIGHYIETEKGIYELVGGGVTIPDKKLYQKGKMKEAYAKGEVVVMPPEVVKKIARSCTEQERAFAELLTKYFDGLAKNSINEISLVIDGWERAAVQNYFPIQSDRAFIVTDNELIKQDLSLTGSGFLKERTHKGQNPIYLMDASDVLFRSIDQVSKYYGMTLAIRDVNAVLNSTYYLTDKEKAKQDKMTGEKGLLRKSKEQEGWGSLAFGSVKKTLEEKWGTNATAYINKLLSDLQKSERNSDALSGFLEMLRGNYARAVISFNPSSVLKQMSSYPVAMAYLDADSLAYGIAREHWKNAKAAVRNLEKYSAVYWYRNQGNATMELRDAMAKRQLGEGLPFGFGWTQKMDSAVTRRLLAACEYQVRKDTKLTPGTQEEIEDGTDAYWQEVAKLFNKVVLNTQSNTSIMERPEMTRANPSNISRFLTMFRTDAFQQYNLMVEAMGRLSYARNAVKENDSAENRAKLKAARKFARKSVTGVVVGQTVVALITSLLSWARFKDKEYYDEEGNFDWGAFFLSAGDDFIEGLAGFLMGGDMLWSAASAMARGDKWYGPEVSSLETITDLTNSAIKLVREVTDGDYRGVVGVVHDIAVSTGTALGLPAGNLEKYLLTATKWIAPEFAEKYENLWVEKTKASLSRESPRLIEEAVGQIMENRTDNLSDEAKKEIARLYQIGLTSAVPNAIPTKLSYTDDNGESVEISMNGSQREQYRKVWGKTVSGTINELIASEEYEKADDEGKAALIKRLYDYAGEIAKNTVEPNRELDKWVQQGENAISYGIPLAEYICFREALTGVDGKDKNGKSIDGLKAQRSVDILEAMGWSDRQEENVYLDVIASDSAKENEEALRKAGLTWTQANDIVAKVGTKNDKMTAISKMNIGENVKRDAMMVYASEKEKKMIQAAGVFGVKMAWYVEVMNNADKDGSGKVSGEEAQEYIFGMDMTWMEKAYLWQMVTDEKEGEKNPFSTYAGKEFWMEAHKNDE